MSVYLHIGFPGGSIVRNPRVNAGDTDLITELERSPGEGPTPVFLLGKSHGVSMEPGGIQEPGGLQSMD